MSNPVQPGQTPPSLSLPPRELSGEISQKENVYQSTIKPHPDASLEQEIVSEEGCCLVDWLQTVGCAVLFALSFGSWDLFPKMPPIHNIVEEVEENQGAEETLDEAESFETIEEQVIHHIPAAKKQNPCRETDQIVSELISYLKKTPLDIQGILEDSPNPFIDEQIIENIKLNRRMQVRLLSDSFIGQPSSEDLAYALISTLEDRPKPVISRAIFDQLSHGCPLNEILQQMNKGNRRLLGRLISFLVLLKEKVGNKIIEIEGIAYEASPLLIRKFADCLVSAKTRNAIHENYYQSIEKLIELAIQFENW